MVVAMCRTETVTGQTVVIDAGRIFHWQMRYQVAANGFPSNAAPRGITEV
jgi:hypothetical protein